MKTEVNNTKSEITDHSLGGSVAEVSFSDHGQTQSGIKTASEGNAKILGGDVSYELNSKLDVKYGDDGKPEDVTAFEASVKGKGDAISAEYSGSYGLASVDADVHVGSLEANIGSKIKIIEDGHIAPQLSIDAKASADIVKGSLGATLGNDVYNGHMKADDSLGHAEVKAGAGVGKIVYEEDNGDKKTSYGAYVKAGAEAYLAQESVSGGFTVWGIKFDAKVEGKAGGAGLTGNAHVDTGSVSAGLGIGALPGLGVEFSVDWTEFKWPWEEKNDGNKQSASIVSGGNGIAHINVYPQRIKADAQTLSNLSKEVSRLSSQVEAIQHDLSVNMLSAFLLNTQFAHIADEMNNSSNDLENMSEALSNISKLYTETEKTIISSGTLNGI